MNKKPSTLKSTIKHKEKKKTEQIHNKNSDIMDVIYENQKSERRS